MRQTSANLETEYGPSGLIRCKRSGGRQIGPLFVTGPTGVAKNPSLFYSCVCRKDVSGFTQGPHEIFWHFQDAKHLPRDQRLQFETPGWRVLDFDCNPMSDEELGRQPDRIVKVPLVSSDREHSFSEDIIVDSSGAVDINLTVMAKVSSINKVLCLDGQ